MKPNALELSENDGFQVICAFFAENVQFHGKRQGRDLLQRVFFVHG